MANTKETKIEQALIPFTVRTFIDLEGDLAEVPNEYVDFIMQEKVGDCYRVLINLTHRRFDIDCHTGQSDENEKWEGIQLSHNQNPYNEEDPGLKFQTLIEFRISDVFPEEEYSYVEMFESRDKEQLTLLFMRNKKQEGHDFSVNQLITD